MNDECSDLQVYENHQCTFESIVDADRKIGNQRHHGKRFDVDMLECHD